LKVDVIRLKNAWITASSRQWGAVFDGSIVSNCKMPVSKITTQSGHFPLSSISRASIGNESTMVNIDFGVSFSSINAIRIKVGSFRVLDDERRTVIGAS
jgi:hypothetical protein